MRLLCLTVGFAAPHALLASRLVGPDHPLPAGLPGGGGCGALGELGGEIHNVSRNSFQIWCPLAIATANLRTKIMDFRGFDSSRTLILRGGTLMTTGKIPRMQESRNRSREILGREIGRTPMFAPSLSLLRWAVEPWGLGLPGLDAAGPSGFRAGHPKHEMHWRKTKVVLKVVS